MHSNSGRHVWQHFKIKMAFRTLTLSYKDISNNILNFQLLSAIFISYINAFKQRQTSVVAFYDNNGLRNFNLKLQEYCKQLVLIDIQHNNTQHNDIQHSSK
jgi:hypothetical protein